MAIAPGLTFCYEFAVQDRSAGTVIGQGRGTPSYGTGAPLVGPEPRFELSAGWLTLYPTKGWTRSFLRGYFSDVERSPLTFQERLKQSSEEEGKVREEAREIVRQRGQKSLGALEMSLGAHELVRQLQIARQEVRRRKGLTRDLASYSVLVGGALAEALQAGDELKFSRDGGGDFRYSFSRGSETVFSAGSVEGADSGGTVAVWQEYDSYPNPQADALREQFKHQPNVKIAETLPVARPYVTARVKDQISQLEDGGEFQSGPYYIFLARSNKKVPALAFEFTPRAVHAAGRVDLVPKEMIVDAARQLLSPQTKLL